MTNHRATQPPESPATAGDAIDGRPGLRGSVSFPIAGTGGPIGKTDGIAAFELQAAQHPSTRVNRAPLEAVISNAELSRRVSRPADYESENRALSTLMQEIASTSGNVLQKLVDSALGLCRAHSAGISILEEEEGHSLFRWHATAGQWSGFLGSTMPREISPCGTVLDRNSMLLLTHPELHYPFPPEVAPPIAEVLLIPFHVGERPVGTVWVIAHDESRKFDREDERVLTSLARFASTAYQLSSASRERKHAEEALRETDRRKDEFLAMLAHELRNPLAAIRNGLQIVRLSGGNKEIIQPTYGMIERQVGQMVRLVDDLLDVSRISRGTIKLRTQRVDVVSTVNHAIEAARALYESKGQNLTIALPAQPVYLDADATRMAQVFGNLLNNACKFTDDGGHIRLAVECESGYAVIRVRDSGIGIPADQLSRIFEMFTQVDESLERSHSGLGIGLTLVKNLVEAHGGTVEAHSAGIGHGSEFIVRLPVAA